MDASNNVIEKLQESYDLLTTQSKKICDFVIKNPEKVQYYSITELSEVCKVGDATITRFCKRMGFNNFSEFKLSIAKSITESYVTTKINEQTQLEKVDLEDSWEIGKNCYLQHIQTITQTMDLLNKADVEKAVDILINAKKVSFMGQGGSALVAMESWSKFINISTKFECLQDIVFQLISVSQYNEGDAIVFFSFSGSTQECMQAMQLAKKRNLKIILITGYKRCPAAEYADVVLICGSTETPLQQGSMLTKTATLLLMDILYHELYNKDIVKHNAILQESALTTVHRLI